MESKRVKLVRATTVAQSVGFYARMIPDLHRRGFDVVGLCSAGPETEMVERFGGRVKTVEMERRISPIKDFVSLVRLVRLFGKEKPDMVHSMTPKAGLLCMMAARLCRVPVRIHTFTGLVFPTSSGLKRKILMLTDWLTSACATHIVPEGEGVRNDLINNRITKKPMHVLGYGNVRGIDMARFNPELEEVREKAKEIRKDGVFTFIFIGRLVRDKGINELVAAFKRLNSENPATRLLLVGRQESALDPVLPSTAEEIRSNPAIEAVGQQEDVRPWLAASDALVFPSYREGFPNVVIEAGAMNLPSIVTDINGSREIIINGKNGVIIPSHDSEALYGMMKDFVDHPDETARMGACSRELVGSRYEQSFVRKCLMDYYDQILSKTEL